jgi:DNA (cytosine-5)-methyltransferase 1
MIVNKINAISLFSCIGIGEYYLKDIGINTVVANEIEPKRCKTYKFFHPNTEVICGDIIDPEVKRKILSYSINQKIDLVIATPPCQGMSSVGKNRNDGTLHDDKRNSLILETLEIIDSILPNYVIIENVPRFLKVKYLYKKKTLTIIDLLKMKYGKNYDIKVDIFNAADFGIPQIRTRAFIRLYKKGLKWHDPFLEKKHISVSEAIGNLPSLESGMKSELKNHWSRIHPENQIFWMKNTPTGETAFNNTIHFPINKDGSKIKGYKNCYRRIDWDRPAPTVTMRNEIISSQNNVHPGRKLNDNTWSDARVLTLRELLILTSMPPDIDLPTDISDTALRQLIGEGIPSLMMKKILEGIIK